MWQSPKASGGVDVIDTASLTDIKTIRTKGGIHNPYVTAGRQIRGCRLHPNQDRKCD